MIKLLNGILWSNKFENRVSANEAGKDRANIRMQIENSPVLINPSLVNGCTMFLIIRQLTTTFDSMSCREAQIYSP